MQILEDFNWPSVEVHPEKFSGGWGCTLDILILQNVGCGSHHETR